MYDLLQPTGKKTIQTGSKFITHSVFTKQNSHTYDTWQFRETECTSVPGRSIQRGQFENFKQSINVSTLPVQSIQHVASGANDLCALPYNFNNTTVNSICFDIKSRILRDSPCIICYLQLLCNLSRQYTQNNLRSSLYNGKRSTQQGPKVSGLTNFLR